MINPVTISYLAERAYYRDLGGAVFACFVTLVINIPSLIAAFVARATGYIGWLPAVAFGFALGLVFGSVLERGVVWPLLIAASGGALAAVFWLIVQKTAPAAFTPR